MSSQAIIYLSPEEYLTLERQAEVKSEYIDGVMCQMAGGSEAHNLIAGNLLTDLNICLRKTPCKVFNSDMKVRAPSRKKFHYPDISVVCGDGQFADDKKDVLLNPILIVEVLSESTAAYDRGKKFQYYQQIESFKEYVLVAQDEAVIETFVRQEDGSWRYTKISGLEERLTLSTVSCHIEMVDIYAKAT